MTEPAPCSRILTEDVLTLEEARAVIADAVGRRPDKATLHRWCFRGVGGTRLEHVRLGGRIYTSSQALTRFIHLRTADSNK